MNISLLQERLPHYRISFFSKLRERLGSLTVYTCESDVQEKKKGFSATSHGRIHIPNINFKGIVLYNPFPLLRKEYDTIVLMLFFAHVTTWILLFTKWIHHKKIILWGQGISVKRYIKEEKKPDWKIKLMIGLADGVWFYMEKERQQWQKIFPDKPMVALNNTIDVERIIYSPQKYTKEDLKLKYGIKQKNIFIFCARFETVYRRTDLLVETIERLDEHQYGFVIIGAGSLKPDFSKYHNVYDFGAVYDDEIKSELFTLSDVYYQPGWVGLSIIEAMAYGKPIFTFHRSEDIKQCVEYSYIENGKNGKLFSSVDEVITYITKTDCAEIRRMGDNAREYVKENLTIDQMVDNALSVFDKLKQ